MEFGYILFATTKSHKDWYNTLWSKNNCQFDEWPWGNTNLNKMHESIEFKKENKT